MNPTSSSNPPRGPQPAGGMNVDDVLFTLFRHKWLILAFVALGLVGALVVRVVRPPLHVSEAKLMLHYVTDNRGIETEDPETRRVTRALDGGADTIINNEIEILTSLDVAKQVAAEVGPEQILAQQGGGTNVLWAAGLVSSGLEVKPPKGSILTVSFKHPDGQIVQPVLEAVIHTYMLNHARLHQGWELEASYIKRRDEASARLVQIEEELKRLKQQANVLAVENTQHDAQVQIDKAREALNEARRELAEQKAIMGQLPPGLGEGSPSGTNGGGVPLEKLQEYGTLATELNDLQRQKLELLRLYKEAHPVVQTVQVRLDKLQGEKAALEKAYPPLAFSLLSVGGGGTNSAAGDLPSVSGQLARLTTRVAYCEANLSNVQAQAWRVLDLQPQIAELERRRNEEQRLYDGLVSSIEGKQKLAAQAVGNAANISVVQNPTPPGLDYKKMAKLVGGVLAACIGLGLGLAFGIDLFLDRSIKRTQDVERHLHLPVFLTIPNLQSTAATPLKWLNGHKDGAAMQRNGKATPNGQSAVVSWSLTPSLQPYVDGLRERLMTYFEVNDLNQKKPKLVAVSGCGNGAGVSTLASGLAASLSKTGDGSVLLVEMNNDQGVVHSFNHGKPGCGLTSALEPESRAGAMVEQNLYVATLQENGKNEQLARVLPRHFTHLVPKLKASDYDYIIFDMPPVTLTSPTPRLASHMDIVLLVLEAEKTGQQAAARAGALFRESRVKVAAVLNKQQQHLPAALASEL